MKNNIEKDFHKFMKENGLETTERKRMKKKSKKDNKNKDNSTIRTLWTYVFLLLEEMEVMEGPKYLTLEDAEEGYRLYEESADVKTSLLGFKPIKDFIYVA